MKKNISLLLYGLLLSAATIHAQDIPSDNLKMQLNFEDVEGTIIKDAFSGINAKTMGAAKVVQMGQYHVLDLGNASGYLDMTAAAGTLLKSTDSYTISVYYRIDDAASLSGNGFFLWSFSTAASAAATTGKYSAYRLNAQRYAISTGGYQNETAIEVGTASAKGKWIHVAYTEKNGLGRLYVNGSQKGSKSGMPKNSANYGTAAVNYCWIGRAPFSGDNYLRKTLVADFRLYDTQLSATQVKQLAKMSAELDDAYINGGGGDNTALLSALSTAEALSTEGYPDGAIATFEDVIAVCRTIAGEDHTQLIYDQYTAELKAAITTFKSLKGHTFNTDGIHTGEYITHRGFLHPGILHTEADFERIRQQLADKDVTVTAAYNILKRADYAQSTAATYPVETIVRGGGSGENYINAARGAAIAYQNALRWRIEGNKNCAQHAVDVLMKWARTCKLVSGDSNYALAAGLYGYEFANAAELMRDYEGWTAADFQLFKEWMLRVWYPKAIGFLRGRNGTWENTGNWGECPGHYWSNWGLCNALCVASIGILCDDVFLYNQGMSFFKYDQVGTFQDPRTANPILNDGLNEFLGNLVVTTTEWTGETGAYGRVGQMQESGRDIGHAVMALGLAVDLAHVGFNQGDDLFAFMDHRLAAGIEFVAAQQQARDDLPWTTYHYADRGLAWWDNRSWKQTTYATGEQIRPYWGTVIGIYEGVKGVEMPFARWAYNKMGYDGGGMGSTSGGYDHLGYSVLMNTRPFATPETRPTELNGSIIMDGKTYLQNDFGGLKNTWRLQSTETLAPNKELTLMPLLPEGEEDTGQWEWSTGQTTRSITVNSDHSFVYRATYTNQYGIKSYQSFALATTGDCEDAPLNLSIQQGAVSKSDTTITVNYGDKLTLNASTFAGWDNTLWDNGSSSVSYTLPAAARDRTIQAIVTSQGGRKQLVNFHITVKQPQPAGISQPQQSSLHALHSPHVYTLQGCRTNATLKKGIYIKNGKKIIVR